jgi:MinD superfamily P-loop ATPase
MIVMLSNCFEITVEPISLRLLEILPQKVEHIIVDVLSGVKIRSKPKIIDRICSALCEVEKIGAHLFGKRIRTNEKCTGCSWCEMHCPASNIHIENGKPKFGWKCL